MPQADTRPTPDPREHHDSDAFLRLQAATDEMLRAKLNEAEQIGMVDEFLHYTIHTIARTAWEKEGDKGPLVV